MSIRPLVMAGNQNKHSYATAFLKPEQQQDKKI